MKYIEALGPDKTHKLSAISLGETQRIRMDKSNFVLILLIIGLMMVSGTIGYFIVLLQK